jgi:hypothetical protein
MSNELLDIINRIKTEKSLKTDEEVAVLLGMTKGNLSNYKKRHAIPFEALYTFSSHEGFIFDWILTGIGPKYQNPIEEGLGKNPKTSDLIKQELLEYIIATLEEGLLEENAYLSPQGKANVIAHIYKYLLSVPHRRSDLKEEIRFFIQLSVEGKKGPVLPRKKD